MNLLQEDRKQLYACKSESDWAKAIAAIKTRHLGNLPDDWDVLMVTGGLEDSLRSHWPKPADLLVDPSRIKYDEEGRESGICVRAIHDGKWGPHDIGTLDKPSLLAFLRSHGDNTRWIEDVCGIILGHGRLHEP